MLRFDYQLYRLPLPPPPTTPIRSSSFIVLRVRTLSFGAFGFSCAFFGDVFVGGPSDDVPGDTARKRPPSALLGRALDQTVAQAT